MAVPYHEASIHPSPPAPSNKWGPYSGAGDFSANMIVILIVLFCTLFLALALNAIIRYLLCARRRRHSTSSSDPEKPSLDEAAAPAAESAPAQVFTAGTKMAGTDQADCAICLHEFADGDRVRVLPACSHGFHAGCVERWLRTKSSCPTCRTTCQVAAGPVPVSA